MKIKNNIYSNWLAIQIFCTVCAIQISCSPKKYLAKNEYLLTKVQIKIDNKFIESYELESVVKQKPVRKILGFPFHASVYNLVDPETEKIRETKNIQKLQEINTKRAKKHENKIGKYSRKANYYSDKYTSYLQTGDTAAGIKQLQKSEEYKLKRKTAINKGYKEKEKVFSFTSWIKSIGEAPVILNGELTDKTVKQQKIVLKNKGYYHADVNVKTVLKRRTARITYMIKSGEPVIIDSVFLTVSDSLLQVTLEPYKNQFILKNGMLLDVSDLQEQRRNIGNYLNNSGYYNFAKEYVFYTIDTLNNRANVTIEIKPFINEELNQVPHQKYSLNKVQVFTDYDPQKALLDPDGYVSQFDTIRTKQRMLPSMFLLKNKEQVIRTQTLKREIYVFPDSAYSQKMVEATYKHLSSLRIYKIVNIQFDELDSNKLDCKIQLTPNIQQSYSVEVEGTNASGNIGAAGNFTYQHRNLFRGAELFDVRLKAAFESQKQVIGETSTKGFNTQEYEVELRLLLPRLLAPQRYQKYAREFNPKTSFSGGFNYQDRPDYTRILLNGNVSYIWRSSEFLIHNFTPVRLSSIRVTNADSAFLEWINRLFIKDSYEDHFIIGSTYSITFNNQTSAKKRNHTFLRINTALSGNSLYAIMKSTSSQGAAPYLVPYLDMVFAQFAKVDLDFRYYLKVSNNTTAVYRVFGGLGLPYGNITYLPFGEQYFSGGANSIRAWQVRTVGPGSYKIPDTQTFPNQSADLKLEANLEYRFKLFWVIEGAWFIDAGNIWTLDKTDKRTGSLFQPQSFFKQLAVGTGVGTRLDFSFFIFRFDFGLKLHNPALEDGSRWLPKNREFFLYKNNWAVNLGIGYPF